MYKDKAGLYKILRPFFTWMFKIYYNPTIVNEHYIPKEGAAVLAGNHKHALDPILVDVCTKRVIHTLAKKELHDGAFGWFFKAIGTIPVDLHAKRNPKALTSAIDYLNKQCLINVSPEAKRNYTEEILLPFKPGAVVMTQRTGCKLVPYAIKGDYRFRSKNLRITFGKPIEIQGMSVEEANALLYSNVKKLLGYGEIRKHLEYPDISVYDMVRLTAGEYREYVSYNYFGKKATYGQFVSQIDRCAHSFKVLGVKKGERVSICMPNTPEAVIAFYALNKIGAVANMIHPLSGKSEIKHFINVSESRVIVTIDIAFDKISALVSEVGLEKCIVVSAADSMPMLMKVGYYLTKGRKLRLSKDDLYISWKDFVKIKGCNESECADSSDDLSGQRKMVGEEVAVILYSGGTTGYPKGIELTNNNFNALAIQSIEACQCLEPKDKVLAIMPVFHGFGLGICVHTVQCFGGTSILLPQFSAKTFHKLLKKYKPNIIAGVPTLYEAMLRNGKLNGYDLSFLKCVISGGDSLSVGLKRKVDKFLKEHGADIQIREGYGLTECVTGSCLTPVKRYKEGSIGVPYPDTYYKIVRPDTEEEVPLGEDGEIIISGPTVMKGYLGEEEENRKTLRKHKDGRIWLYTKDMGSMDDEGFVYFKQRLKRIIISSGYCIYPQYIEDIIDSHPKVLMSCVIGIKDSYRGQIPKAYIVPKEGFKADETLLADIKAYCEDNLTRYAWPQRYEFRKELPKTLVGKIAYTKLEEEEI